MDDHFEQQLVNDVILAMNPIVELFDKWIDIEFVSPFTDRIHEDCCRLGELSTFIHVYPIGKATIMVVNFFYRRGAMQVDSVLEHALIKELKVVLIPITEKYKDSAEIVVEIMKCEDTCQNCKLGN